MKANANMLGCSPAANGGSYACVWGHVKGGMEGWGEREGWLEGGRERGQEGGKGARGNEGRREGVSNWIGRSFLLV